MSRIGSSPVTIPSGVDVDIDGATVTVTGPKGALTRTLPGNMTLALDDGELQVDRPDDERRSKAMHGLSRSLVQNMVTGVTDGYRKELEIVGVGYRAELAGDALNLQLGYSHRINFPLPKGISAEVPKPTQVVLKGIDKALLGQTAAKIRDLRKPEPYKGKGIKYVEEKIRRKVGKTGAK